MNRTRISEADFATGLFVGLAARRVTNLGTRPLDVPVVTAFNRWAPSAAEAGLELRCTFILDEIRQDCPGLRAALGAAIARGVAHTTSDHQLLIDVHLSFTNTWLERLPGPASLWEKLADLTITELRNTHA